VSHLLHILKYLEAGMYGDYPAGRGFGGLDRPLNEPNPSQSS
jgi:hypothetical protein